MSLRELSVTPRSHVDAVWSLDWSESSQLLTGGVDEILKLWKFNTDATSIEQKPALQATAQTMVQAGTDATLPVSASLSLLTVLTIPNTNIIASSSMDGTIRLYDTVKMESRRLDAGPLESWTMCIDPSGQYLATGSQKGYVSVFSVSSGEKVATLQGDKAKEGESSGAWVMSVAWSADGRYIAAGHFDGRITLFSMEGAQSAGAPKPLTPHGKAVRTLKFAPDSSLLFSGSDDMHVHWYETATGSGQLMHDLYAHQSWVTSIDVPKVASSSSSSSSASSSPTHFATVSTDKKVKVWNLSTKECTAVHELDSSAWCVAFDPSGEKLAVGTELGSIALFKVSTQ